LLGPLEYYKGDDLKRYEAAALAWVQGVLRMESGAAITASEERKYTRAFFPLAGDSLAVQKQKQDLRTSTEETMRSIASGSAPNETVLQALSRARGQADAIAAQPVGAASAPTSKTVNITGLGPVTISKDANGVVTYVPATAAATASPASNYTPPASLGEKAGSPKVEPKTSRKPAPTKADPTWNNPTLGHLISPKDRK
jgi:hypothetical protein